MADSISASPRQPALGFIADLLRKGAKAVKPYEPAALPLVSDTLDSLGRGTDAWSYGDRLLGPAANAPLVNERTEDMIGALPIGAGGAASKAMLVGALPGDAAVQKMLRLLRLGATTDEAWWDTKRAIVPTQPSAIKPNLDNPDALSYVREVSDKGYTPNKNLQYTPSEKEALVKKLDPIKQPSALLRAQNTDLFLPGKYRLSELVDHPELFKARPDVKDLRVTIDPKEKGYGSYSPSSRGIRLGTMPFIETPDRGHMSTLLHELTHDQQNMFGMPRGSSPNKTRLTAPERDLLSQTYEINNDQLARNDPVLQWNLYNMAKERQAPYNMYKNILGEQQARAVQKRQRMPEDMREFVSPTTSYDNLEGGINPEYMDWILGTLRSQSPTP